jgi:hypothetical protein
MGTPTKKGKGSHSILLRTFIIAPYMASSHVLDAISNIFTTYIIGVPIPSSLK